MEFIIYGHPVLITLGGGHYAPKANKLALEPNVWLGHMLANHSLPFGTQDDPGTLGSSQSMLHFRQQVMPIQGAKLSAMWRRNHSRVGNDNSFMHTLRNVVLKL